MMVAYSRNTPPDPSRTLSPAIADRLRAALAARWDETTPSDADLTSALGEAARDAKSRQMRPEELLLALKAIEGQVAEAVKQVNDEDRELLHHWLVGACMRAYFADEPA
jgi:hypothetical protein